MKTEYLHSIEGNKYLSIETTYQLGGTNYGTGQAEKRGIYLHFTTVDIEENYRRFSLYGDGNCKVFVKELKRKSQKQLELFHKYVLDNIEEFIESFNTDKQQLFTLIDKYNS